MKKLTYKQLKYEAMMNYDKYDSWGSCMSLFFAIATELYLRKRHIPKSWQYRASIIGDSHEDGDYAGEIMQLASTSALHKMGKVLERLSSMLITQERDY